MSLPREYNICSLRPHLAIRADACARLSVRGIADTFSTRPAKSTVRWMRFSPHFESAPTFYIDSRDVQEQVPRPFTLYSRMDTIVSFSKVGEGIRADRSQPQFLYSRNFMLCWMA